MPRPCACDRLPPSGEDYGPAFCRPCWLFHHDARYQALWGRGPAAGRCRHQGAATGATVRCPSCRGHVELKLLACAVHGSCTPSKPAPGVACCQGCPDFAAHYPPVTLRNLLYHVYPVAGNGVWQRCLATLLARVEIFDGRRVVAVATGPGLDPPAAVRAFLRGHVHEVVEVPNDSSLREVATFEALFARVETRDPGQATLYAHAKGVTHGAAHQAHRWHDALAETCLDWPAVEESLREYPVTSAFKKVGAGWHPSESASAWHYSGSWFWFRNAELFARDWRRVDRFWSGIEPYPSLHFTAAEAGALVLEAPVPDMNLYDAGYWGRAVEPALARRRARRAAP